MFVFSNPLSPYSLLGSCYGVLLKAVWWFFTKLRWEVRGDQGCVNNKNCPRYIRRNFLKRFVQDCITQSCIHKIILKLHLEYSWQTLLYFRDHLLIDNACLITSMRKCQVLWECRVDFMTLLIENWISTTGVTFITTYKFQPHSRLWSIPGHRVNTDTISYKDYWKFVAHCGIRVKVAIKYLKRKRKRIVVSKLMVNVVLQK